MYLKSYYYMALNSLIKGVLGSLGGLEGVSRFTAASAKAQGFRIRSAILSEGDFWDGLSCTKRRLLHKV